MPVSQQTPVNEYVGNGSVTTFPYTFYLLSQSDLRVFVNGTQEVSGFSVTGVGVGEGGSVIFTVAPASGAVIRFQRFVAVVRDTDYQDGAGLSSQVLDNDFDRTVMMVQDLNEAVIKTDGSGSFDAVGERIVNLAMPVVPTDAASKNYVDTAGASNAAQAGVSAVEAAASATAAAGSATNASASATAASDSASAASTSATNSASSATAASGSATSAANSATAAGNSATAASNSAGSASTSATAASLSETNASTSATTAGTHLFNFQRQWVQAGTADPTLDGNGNALTAGDLYYNLNLNEIRVFTGSTWFNMSSGPNAVAKTGDTMTGLLTLSGDPTAALHAATKQYADTKLALSGGTVSGALTVTGATTLSSLTVSNNVSAGNYFIQSQATTDAGTFGFGNANGPGIITWGSGTGGAGSMEFYTGGAQRAVITSAGNVGIGTDFGSVRGKLNLREDDTDGPALVLTNRQINAGVHKFGSILFDAYRDVSNPSYVAGIWAEGTSPFGNTCDLVFATQQNGTVGYPTEVMRINQSGNVAIGTTDTSSGRLRVKGGQAGTQNCSVAMMTPGQLQGERANLSFYSTFQNTADSGPRRCADILAGYDGASWGSEFMTFHVNSDPNDAQTLTPERMRLTASGTLTVETVIRTSGSSGRGYAAMQSGGTANSGYLEFFASNGIRQGYIGFASTAGPQDQGTLPYIANIHEFNGVVTVNSGSLRIGKGSNLISRYVSGEVACPTSSGIFNNSHGGGRVPDLFSVVLRCVIAEHGWGVGTEIQLKNDIGATNREVQISADAVQITLAYVGASLSPAIRNTAGTLVTVSSPNWRVVYKAHWL